MALRPRDRQVLDVERSWWLDPVYAGAGKRAVIEHRLGISNAAYYAALRRLVASDAALAYDPLLVRRLRLRQRLRRRSRYAPAPPRREPR
jgi:hypothetical protein